jgi:hypothetical protein
VAVSNRIPAVTGTRSGMGRGVNPLAGPFKPRRTASFDRL